jgi:hypothetical protein
VTSSDVDATLKLGELEQQALLAWLDALWGCFLEDVERLRNKTAVKASQNTTPLQEFRWAAGPVVCCMCLMLCAAAVEWMGGRQGPAELAPRVPTAPQLRGGHPFKRHLPRSELCLLLEPQYSCSPTTTCCIQHAVFNMRPA